MKNWSQEMKIKIAFTRETEPDLVSKGIMKFMGTNYSHVFFVLDDIIYHAVGEGVTSVPLAEYLKDHIIVAEKDVDIFMTEGEFLTYMKGANGKEYSNSQYLGFIFKPLKRFFRNKDKKMICSELVATVLNYYGTDESVPYFPDPDFISPKDIYVAIMKD